MIRIGLISDNNENKRELINSLKEMGYKVIDVNNIKVDSNFDEENYIVFKECNFILIDIKYVTYSIVYRIGILRGLKKKIILISQDHLELPYELRRYPVFKYEKYDLYSGKLSFIIKENIEKIIDYNSIENSNLKISFDEYKNSNIYIEKQNNAIKFEKDVYSYFKNSNLFSVLNNNISPTEYFDILLWNKSEDPSLLLLGNPIPVLIKIFKENIDMLDYTDKLINMLKFQSLILITERRLSKNSRVFRNFEIHNKIFINLTLNDLNNCTNTNELISIIKSFIIKNEIEKKYV